MSLFQAPTQVQTPMTYEQYVQNLSQNGQPITSTGYEHYLRSIGASPKFLPTSNLSQPSLGINNTVPNVGNMIPQSTMRPQMMPVTYRPPMMGINSSLQNFSLPQSLRPSIQPIRPMYGLSSLPTNFGLGVGHK